MKKTVRLTESDLTRIIKRVIRETQNDIPKEIMGCATEVLTLSDMVKIPTCVELAMGVMTTKKIPTDFMKGMKCASELATLDKGPEDATKFFTCVAGKVTGSNPIVMNTNESRKRR